MDKIRDWLYIGSLRDTQNLAALEESGISAVLQLAGASPQKGIVSYLLPVEDGEPLAASVLREGLSFVADQRQKNKRVLIACAAGVSRSATFAVAALKEAEQIPLLDALRMLVAAHPETLPNPILWRSLCDFYSESVALVEMVRICRPRNIPGAGE
ncbi:MAG: dual specificity protein phosphatase family protein [Fibrella sp.]|nr:dual specificity protein phosphatase family protein [Armatimonadota bacterium]